MDMEAQRRHQADQAAAHWHARQLAPDSSDQERAAFERWRQQPDHARAYAELEALWRCFDAPEMRSDPQLQAYEQAAWHGLHAPDSALDALDASSTSDTAGAPAPDWKAALAALPPRRRASAPAARSRQRWLGWAVAAAAASVVLVAGIRHYAAPPPPTTYATEQALRSIVLDDGTRIHLDVGTQIDVRMQRGLRAVELRHGRALFDVAHDQARPFVVDLGATQVTVLGTRFQSMRDIDAVSVTLDSGVVQMSLRGAAGERSERMAPGEQISYTTQQPEQWRRRRVDSEAAMAWSRGRLIFRSTPLAEAVREVNRYAAEPKFRLVDAALGDMPVSGNFLAGQGELVAAAWAATLPLRMQRTGTEILISADPERTEKR